MRGSNKKRAALSDSVLGSAIEPGIEERQEGACGRRTESNTALSGAVLAVTTTAAADAASAGNASQSVQHQLSTADQLSLVPLVLQLQQQQQLRDQAAGKRRSPATPSKQTVAEEKSPDSAPRPGPKRLAVHVPVIPVECASGATLQKTDATECRSGPHMNESDMESSDSDSELTAEDKFNIAAVAAMSGDINARAFILELYTKGHLPPDLASRANEVLRRTLDNGSTHESSSDEDS